MTSPFSLSDDKLIILLNSYSSWLEIEGSREKNYAKEQRDFAKELKETLLDAEYLSKLSDEMLADEILTYSRKLEGPVYIRLGTERIKGEIVAIRRNLLYLIEGKDDAFQKAEKILEGEFKIPIFAKAFWSPLLQAQYPEDLPNWNNKTERFLEKVGVNLFTTKLSIKEKYKLLSKAFLYLRELDSGQDFYTLNHLMHYGTEIKEGVDLLEELINPSDRRYWQIAPGEKARLWEDLRKNSIAAVGYAKMNTDLSGLNKEQMIKLYKDTNPESSETEAKIQAGMLFNFVKLKPGDKFVTNKGRSLLLGLGIIKGQYQFRPDRPEYRHAIPVEYYKISEDGIPIPENLKGKFGKTIVPFSKSEFQAIEKLFEIDTKEKNPQSAFSDQAFELLKLIRENPTNSYYQSHKDEFKNFLEAPFQKLFRDVCLLLPPSIMNLLESEKGNFSRIVKNDYGKGGAWDFYWGALFPKGGKRIQDAQLFLWMNADRFEYGFYIGEYGGEQRKRFVLNCSKFKEILPDLLEESLSDGELKFGKHEEFLGKTQDSASGEIPNWKNWLSNPEAAGIHVYVQVSRDNVLAEPADKIARSIASKFEQLFPLVLLATSDDPVKMISEYEELEVEKITNPIYPLVECAKETGVGEEILSRWVRAIERKGQAIFYGPPGTGKTFIAEKIARHLIGGGDGFSELVQFHPAYAYEDFIQGMRPKVNTEGTLDYPIVSGRFLNFCVQAGMRQGKCVLIIDEINRANLSRVFGELMYLLEYRNREIPLASGGQLQIPNNVRILGTMNTADRSIALVDYALRRRFAFLPLYPDYEILRKFHKENDFPVNELIGILETLNKKIGDRHYQVGITFFLRKDLREQIEDIWRMEIEPYLEEYFFDRRDTADEFLWDKIKDKVLS